MPGAEAGKEAVATMKAHIVCTFYQSGICKGKKCKFLHTQGPKDAPGLTRKNDCIETEITPGTSIAVTETAKR